MTLLELSVPYSSGHRLKPGGVPFRYFAAHSFSPLFIGSQVETVGRLGLDAAQVTFSPLFIGSQVETPLAARAGSRSSAFSPLFIGSQVETALTETDWFQNHQELSVPYSSGHRLKLNLISSSVVEGAFQSPIHRVTG